MIKRIETLMQSFNLSPARFAEVVGVQRSSLSHILSGRNKPSLDFILKILSAYPEINPGWLLTGKGQMMGSSANSAPVRETLKNGEEKKIGESTEKPEKAAKEKSITGHTFSGKKRNAVKVVIFYSDNTFEEYLPVISPE